MSKFEINKGAELPNFAATSRANSLYPFDDMTEVGQYFSVPYTEYKTPQGNDTNSHERMRGVVNQRNKRDESKTFNVFYDRENSAVQVWLVALDPSKAKQPSAGRGLAAPAPAAAAPAPATSSEAKPAARAASK